MFIASYCDMDMALPLAGIQHCHFWRGVLTSDCNFGIPNSVIPAVFANLESWDWQHPNPGIPGLQQIVKVVVFDCWMIK